MLSDLWPLVNAVANRARNLVPHLRLRKLMRALCIYVLDSACHNGGVSVAQSRSWRRVAGRFFSADIFGYGGSFTARSASAYAQTVRSFSRLAVPTL
jgi:hypothetical protein